MNFKVNKNPHKLGLKGVKYNSINTKKGAPKGKKTLAEINKQLDDIPLDKCQQRNKTSQKCQENNTVKLIQKQIKDLSHHLNKNSDHLQPFKQIDPLIYRQQLNNNKVIEIQRSKKIKCSGSKFGQKMFRKVERITLPHYIRTSKITTCIVTPLRIYVIGGRDLAFKSYNDIWKYDLQFKFWAKISFDFSDSPGSLSNHSAVQLRQSIYVYGGLFLNNSQNKRIFQFNIPKKAWMQTEVKSSSKSDEIPAARDQHEAVADSDSSFMVFGGFTQNKKTNQFWRFNVDTLQWTDLNKTSKFLPTQRSGHILIKYKQYVYTYGGCDDDGNRLGDLWRYSLDGSRSWEFVKFAVGDIPISRSGHSAAILQNDKLLIFGGMHGVLHENNQLFQLDLETFKWQQLCSQKLCTTPNKYMPKFQPMMNQIRSLAGITTEVSARSNSVTSPQNGRAHINEFALSPGKKLISSKGISTKKLRKAKSKGRKPQNYFKKAPMIQIKSPGPRPFTSLSSSNSTPNKRYQTLKLSSRIGGSESNRSKQNFAKQAHKNNTISKMSNFRSNDQLLEHSRSQNLPNNSRSSFQASQQNYYNPLKHSNKKRANALAKILTGSDINVPGFNLNQPTMEVMKTSYLFKNVIPNKLDNMKKKKFLLDKSIGFPSDQSVMNSNNAIQLSCRRPPARQGHTATAISDGQMLIFGGDRNRMSFNDMYIFSFDIMNGDLGRHEKVVMKEDQPYLQL